MAFLVGLLCGVISGLGLGGGSLLMLWLTAFVGRSPENARCINLLYFLPTAGAALLRHQKNHYIDWQIVWPAAISGSICAVGGSLLASVLDVSWLKKGFAVLLLGAGVLEFLRNMKKNSQT